jgi:riboflavin synthase
VVSLVFTGLVQDLGEVKATEHAGAGTELTVRTRLAPELREGDSIAVNGVCLTATAVGADTFAAAAMHETLANSSLGELRPGASVNLELPLRADERLGGHIVQGHVDGLGEIAAVQEDGFARRVRIEADPELVRYVIVKGSIAVDGVSLTAAEVDDTSFTVSLIPETLTRTTLGAARPGTKVNLEVDMLAKYVEKLARPLA